MTAQENLEDLLVLLASGEASDGHHTHRELYDYRMLYNAHAAAGWVSAGIPVVKSWAHADGELCFGGGWFVVVATLPTGQVGNHYRAVHWDLFAGVPEVDMAPAWDGHTPSMGADRLRAALAAAPSETETGRVVRCTDPKPWCPTETHGHIGGYIMPWFAETETGR